MVVIILSPPKNSLRLRPRCGAHTSRFDSTNLLTQAFPRTAAVGERLWSARNVTEVYDAGVRLHAWRCRLLRRGLATAPVTGGLAIGAFGTAPPHIPHNGGHCASGPWEPTYTPPWE